MSEAHFQERFPRWVLFAAGFLIVMTVTVSLIGRLTRDESWARAGETPVASRDLQFFDEADGTVRVVEAGSGEKVALIGPGEGSFLRATLRGLAHARRASGTGPEVPFQLSYFQDGHLVLHDAVTRRTIDFGAFGETNARAFGRLLVPGGSVQ